MIRSCPLGTVWAAETENCDWQHRLSLSLSLSFDFFRFTESLHRTNCTIDSLEENFEDEAEEGSVEENGERNVDEGDMEELVREDDNNEDTNKDMMRDNEVDGDKMEEMVRERGTPEDAPPILLERGSPTKCE